MANSESQPPGVRKFRTIQGGNGGDGEMEQRIARLEESVTKVREDVASIKATLSTLATRTVVLVGFVVLAFLSDGGTALLRMLMTFAAK
jgi:hypothetical protein